MKVAYFINQYPGISHSFIRREIQALERNGVDVVRFAIRPSKDVIIADEDFAESERTRHIVTTDKLSLLGSMVKSFFRAPIGALGAFAGAIAMGLRSEAGLVRHVLYYGEALVLADWLHAENLIHVHAHFGTNAATIAMLGAPLANATYSFTVHGPEEFEKPALISLPRKIEHAAFTVGVSQFGASQLKKLVPPETWPRIEIVHCGIEKSFYESAPDVAASPAEFVCVGRLCAEKGQIDLVNAAARVAKDHPSLKVILIGDGPMRGEIEEAIAKNSLERNVILAGWKTPAEVRDAILHARAFILPSYAEGLPVSIMEALALKRPVISTYIAGIPELVTEDCGWLAPAGHIDAIAEAMRAALKSDEQTLAAMGEEGRRRVIARHDMDQEARKLAAHFARVMEQHS